MVFAGHSGFLHFSQLASHKLATIDLNVTKFKFKFKVVVVEEYEDCVKEQIILVMIMITTMAIIVLMMK